MKSKICSLALILLIAMTGSPLILSAQNVQIRGRAVQLGPGPVTMRAGEGQAWLGVGLTDVTGQKVQELKLPGEYGAIVQQVTPNSPAAKAGIEVNDVILEFAGTRLWSVAQLQQWVRETPPGRTVTLRISRAGKKLDLKVTLGSLAGHVFYRGFAFTMPNIRVPEAFNFRFSPTRARLGIRGENLTPQLAEYFGVKQGKGVLVTEVEKGTPAEKAGLKAGDCIVRVNSAEIGNISDLMHALNTSTKQPAEVVFVRNGRQESVSVQLAPPWSPVSQQQTQAIQRSIERQVERLQNELPRIQEREKHAEERLRAIEQQIRSRQTT